MTTLQRVVMVATSYPRFPGDTVGTFLEPIAHEVAARGHEVHMVLPWHPEWQRGARDGDVHFHLFRYAPVPALNVFGYASALRADVQLRPAAALATPLALAAGWRAARRVARKVSATVMHGHWVVPGGTIAALAGGGLPLVVSLHGSDVYMAERHAAVGRAARWTFSRAGFTTACSDDLRRRAVGLGASPDRSATVPYGVDASRFRPDPDARHATRRAWGIADHSEVVLGVGRFVRKKGFEYLIDAVARLAAERPALRLVLAGGGDLEQEFRAGLTERGIAQRVVMPGVLRQGDVAHAMAAADIVAVPSVRDEAGNVDGLPNVVMEALASGTPVVASPAGGIGSSVRDEVTGLLVPERDVAGLAAAIRRLLDDRAFGRALGLRARQWALEERSWARVAESLEYAYDMACRAPSGRA